MIAIPNIEKPQSCLDCMRYLNFKCGGDIQDCPIIEIDENDPMLLEFLNEFDKWRAYKELMDSIRMAQKKGEANDIR